MKKILFITPFAPSNIGAAMKFTKKTIETLAEIHQVDLVYFIAEGEKEYVPNCNNIRILKSYRVSTKNRVFSIAQKPWFFPTFSARFRKGLKNALKKWIKEEKYDLMFLDHSQSFIYGKYFTHVKKILMSHDVIYQRISRTRSKFISAWCHNTESKLIKQPNASVFSFSTKDKEIIDHEYGINSMVTCGNIDEIAYNTVPKEKNNTFIFFGQWVRKDNSEGLEWFLKEVYDKTPKHTSYKIIGRGLPERIQTLIKHLERIEYRGFVENPYQEIANSRAVLSPLFSGAGVKFKVLESIACGTPVIGSKIAFEGIPADYNKFMLLANTPEEYVELINNTNYSINECMEMKKKFLNEYVNPYIIKYINELLK